jgi:hypothetical protein
VIVKERERGRVVKVTTRIVYGSEQQVAAALNASPVSTTLNTGCVERNITYFLTNGKNVST